MNPRKFNLLNNLTGWIVFGIAAFVYLSTIEPFASLWDCGEYISGAFKLEVVHPPGNPFFLIMMHFFTLFAPDHLKVAKIVNGISAISSAFVILFLYWSIVLIGLKLIKAGKNEYISISRSTGIIAAGITGALSFTFTDSFWFSAVEGEVYAMSALFTAIVFWLLLKWERHADEPYHLKYFLLIFYLMGISIGVHLLSLLVLPVVALVFYLRKTEVVKLKGLLFSLVVGFIFLAIINVFVIKWIPLVSSWFELLFVNVFGLPFWSGVIFFLLVLTALLVYFIYYTYRSKKAFVHLGLTSLLLVLIGFSSYTLVIIRSTANPPIDYSNPENIFHFISYVNREQYEDRPLFYGQQFTTEQTGYKPGKAIYSQDKIAHRYIKTGYSMDPVFASNHKKVLPRMSDTREDKANAYRYWSGMRPEQNQPTFKKNIRFLFRYQLGFMYFRYLAWNFIGKQNDQQGHGGAVAGGFMSGNWISGFSGFDKSRTGNSKLLPADLKNNTGRNRMYFIPFIFGIIGLIYLFFKDKRTAFITLLLFFITGLLLAFYENPPPLEPRERDYTLIGSFFVFSIWIGIAVFAITRLFNKIFKKEYLIITISVFAVSFIAVPCLIANQEWDDHDRSHRYTTHDNAINYLNSCAPNALLFTSGDNDTYPLWYCQEVEGIRTDVRVVNLELLTTGWNVDQLRRKINDSEPFWLSLQKEQTEGEQRIFVLYNPNPSSHLDTNKYYSLQTVLGYIESDKQENLTQLEGNFMIHTYPVKNVYLPVNKEKVLKNGTVRFVYADRITDSVKFTLRDEIYKNHLVMLDILASNNWERPVYFTINSGTDNYLGLSDYLQTEGLTYRLVPVKKIQAEKTGSPVGRIDPELTYNNLMYKFRWSNLDDKKAMIDEVTRNHLNNYRNVISGLCRMLLLQHDTIRVNRLLQLCQSKIPPVKVPYRVNAVQMVELYYQVGDSIHAIALTNQLNDVFCSYLDYYLSLQNKFFKSSEVEIKRNYYGLTYLNKLARRNGKKELVNKLGNEIVKYDQKLGERY